LVAPESSASGSFSTSRSHKKKKKSASVLQFLTLQQIKEKKPLMHDLAGYLPLRRHQWTCSSTRWCKAGLVKRLADTKIDGASSWQSPLGVKNIWPAR